MDRTARTTANLLVLATLAAGAIAAKPATAAPEDTTTTACEQEWSPVATLPPTLTVSGGSVTVEWNASSRADTYTVRRSTQSNSGRFGSAIHIDAGAATSVVDDAGEGTYRYMVIAGNCVGTNNSAAAEITVSGSSTDTTTTTTTPRTKGRKG